MSKLYEKLLEVEREFDMDISDYVDEEVDNTLDIIDGFDSYLDDMEFVYYGRAMDFLIDHDPSLEEAMEEAEEVGYETKDLNSCRLAYLLQRKYLSDDFYNKILPQLKEVEENDED